MLSSLLQAAINARSTKARLVTKNPTIRSLTAHHRLSGLLLNAIQISKSPQPLRFVRSSRNDHGPIRPRRLGQVDLLVEPLVSTERRLSGEQIRGDICVLLRGAGRRMS